jgi:hypothetical protein
VGSGVAQTKVACWDGEFGRPEAANTFGDGELHCYAHSLVDTLDFESLLNLLEHHCVLILNLGRNHEGTFQSGGGIVSRDGNRSGALHHGCSLPINYTTVCVASAGLGTKRPASATCWSAGTVGQKLAPDSAATRDGGFLKALFSAASRRATRSPLCSLSLS